MTYHVHYQPDKPHRCNMPYGPNYSVGTVIECQCGKFYLYFYSFWWQEAAWKRISAKKAHKIIKKNTSSAPIGLYRPEPKYKATVSEEGIPGVVAK